MVGVCEKPCFVVPATEKPVVEVHVSVELQLVTESAWGYDLLVLSYIYSIQLLCHIFTVFSCSVIYLLYLGAVSHIYCI